MPIGPLSKKKMKKQKRLNHLIQDADSAPGGAHFARFSFPLPFSVFIILLMRLLAVVLAITLLRTAATRDLVLVADPGFITLQKKGQLGL